MAFEILGTGSFIPDYRESNEEYIERTGVDSNSEWIEARSGITSRPLVRGPHLHADMFTPDHLLVPEFEHPTSDMGVIAIRQALGMAIINADELDAIYVGSWTPFDRTPGVQDRIAQELDIEAAGADVNAACASFVEAFSYGATMLEADTNDINTIAIVGAETMSQHVNWKDRTNSFLFGDGAGAIILRRNDAANGRLLWSESGVLDKETYKYLAVPQVGGVEMDGGLVYKTAIPAAVTSIRRALGKAGLDVDDLDLLIPHQANRRITRSVQGKLELSDDRVVDVINFTANSSSATVPIALDIAMHSGRVLQNSTLAMIGFGAGMTYSTAVIRTN